MTPMQVGRLLMVLGVVLLVAGIALIFCGKLPWLGRLPGDLVWRRGNLTVFLPLATSILVSLLLTLALSFLRR